MDRPDNGTNIVINSGIDTNSFFKFEQIDNHWGYIVHIASGKCIHPESEILFPENGDELILHDDRHAGAFFAIDQANNIIMHKGGKYAHPDAGYVHTPPNGDDIVLQPDINDGMKFEFVSPFNTSEEILVYGKPKLVGSWKVIDIRLNPLAVHTYKVKHTIGRSKTESTEYSFKYKWEASGGISDGMFSASVSQSLELMLKRTTSMSWSKEIETIREITVFPGISVITWQYNFEITQDYHRGVYHSNILADTSSLETPPDLAGDAKYF